MGTALALKTYHFDAAQDHWTFGFEWGRIARWIVETNIYSLDGITPTSITDPLYVFIIAFFFLIFGPFSTNSAFILILFQSLLYGFSTWAIFVLAEKIFGPREARVSALLFACYPPAIFFAVVRIDPSALSILLLTLIFLSFLAFQESNKLKFVFRGAILTGLLILTSSKCLSLLFIIPVWLFLMNKGYRLRMILPSLLFIGLTVIVMLPWSLRNALTLGEYSLTRGGFGYHVWVGNNPNATGHYDQISPADNPIAQKIGWNNELPEEVLWQGHTFDYLSLTVSWIKDNPKDFVMMTLKRIKYFWYIIPRATISKGELAMARLFLIMTILAAAGAYWSRDDRGRVSLILLFLAFFPVLFYLTHVVYYRHRFHIEPFVLIIASYGCVRLWEMLRNSFPAPRFVLIHNE
jgi:4-amino-4-deoxy-L-arabinose transferase-like glycosyltransferase